MKGIFVRKHVGNKSKPNSRRTSSRSKRNVKKSQESSPPISLQLTGTHSLNRWRSGWEIDAKRQQYLDECRRKVPDVEKGMYPFKGVEPNLTAADIGWLLETYENGRGPVDLYQAQQQGRRGLDLRGADLQRADLRRFPLGFMLGGLDWEEQRKFDSARADMASIHLEGAWLEYADLTGAILYRAHLEKAHLSWSNLEGAYLDEANLMGATLTQACLNGATLYCAHLEGASLNGAWLGISKLGQQAILNEVHLEGADLRDARLEKADLYKAFLQGADLRGAYLEKADLNDAHLEGAQLQGASLQNAQLKDAHLEGADLSGANLEGVDLTGAYLEGAILTDARLKGAKLQRAHLEGTDFNRANLENAILRQGCLAGSNLRRSHLEGADLRDAHLEGKCIDQDNLVRIQQWVKKFSETLNPANLQGAFLDAGTDLESLTLSEARFGCISLVDVHWSDVNLSVIEWSQVKKVGEEDRAVQWQNHPKRANFVSFVIEDYRLAIRAYRQLAVELQSRGLNEESARFGYRAQMLHRKVLWMQIGPWKSVQKLKIWRQRSWIWKRLIVLQQRLQHSWIWNQATRIRQWIRKVGIKVQQLGNFIFSIFLSLLAGYGYRPGRAFICYILVIFGFTFSYSLFGHIPLLPDALVFSIMSFHGRGFFPSLSGETSLHNPLVVLAAAEAVIGFFIEISFIATFTQRYFGK